MANLKAVNTRLIMKIKLKVGFAGYAEGQEITIEDENGIPTSHFWRRRLKDAEIDNSVEIVQTKATQKPKKTQTKGKLNDNAS